MSGKGAAVALPRVPYIHSFLQVLRDTNELSELALNSSCVQGNKGNEATLPSSMQV